RMPAPTSPQTSRHASGRPRSGTRTRIGRSSSYIRADTQTANSSRHPRLPDRSVPHLLNGRLLPTDQDVQDHEFVAFSLISLNDVPAHDDFLTIARGPELPYLASDVNPWPEFIVLHKNPIRQREQHRRMCLPVDRGIERRAHFRRF